jgi:ABC-type polar amino acid transport system ATPase subunit
MTAGRGEVLLARAATDRVVFMHAGECPTAEFLRAPQSERARVFLSKVLAH